MIFNTSDINRLTDAKCKYPEINKRRYIFSYWLKINGFNPKEIGMITNRSHLSYKDIYKGCDLVWNDAESTHFFDTLKSNTQLINSFIGKNRVFK